MSTLVVSLLLVVAAVGRADIGAESDPVLLGKCCSGVATFCKSEALDGHGKRRKGTTLL